MVRLCQKSLYSVQHSDRFFPSRPVKISGGPFKLRIETTVPEKSGPAFICRIALFSHPYIVIHHKAVPASGHKICRLCLMHGSQPPAKSLPVITAAPAFQIFQKQKCRSASARLRPGAKHMRRTDGFRPGNGRQSDGLCLK